MLRTPQSVPTPIKVEKAKESMKGRPPASRNSPPSSSSNAPEGIMTQVSKEGSTAVQSTLSTDSKKGRIGALCGCVKRQDSTGDSADPLPVLLGAQRSEDEGKRTLVLDLDETLVHSSFRPVNEASIIVTVEIEGKYHDIYVLKRPGVDKFLAETSKWYEIVIFTASLAKYADPLMDQLDPENICSYRLFRESCTQWNGSYVKDLARMGRHLDDIIIIDNSPLSYAWQPDNAIPIRSWFDDFEDRELFDLIPILQALSMCSDIPAVLRQTIRVRARTSLVSMTRDSDSSIDERPQHKQVRLVKAKPKVKR